MDKGSNLLLSVKNLRVEFTSEKGSFLAVDNVSFDLEKGTTLSIVGESGSGKSVTSLAIMGLLASNAKLSGEIWFNSNSLGWVNLLSLPPKQMRSIRGGEIAMVFQEPMTSLNPVMTCGAQVMEAIRLHRPELSKEEARQLVFRKFRDVHLDSRDEGDSDEAAMAQLEKIYHSFPHQLSGGQKQRVMIAMALACDPELIIADEPTTALDVSTQRAILDIFQELTCRDGISVLFISHDLGVVAEMSDRVMVMYQGKQRELADVLTIFDNPKDPYTRGLFSCRPRVDLSFLDTSVAYLKRLPTISDFIEVDARGNVKAKKVDNIGIGETIFSMIDIEEESSQSRQPEPSMPVLKVEGLSKVFWMKKKNKRRKERFFAVDNVSFEVFRGETVGLVGESGSGKSTLSRLILRLLEADSGRVEFGVRAGDGSIQYHDIFALSERSMRSLRRYIQIVFQDPFASLNPRMSIGEILTEPMRLFKLYGSSKEQKERAFKLLEDVGLDPRHVFHRYPHEFSGGQRQRICIARALATDPQFIIFDESVSALDVSVQAEVLNLINELKEQYHFSSIFISHDLAVIRFIADRVMVMKDGKIIEIGDSRQIFENPSHPYTQALLDAIPKGDIIAIRKKLEERAAIRSSRACITS
uniref:ABC transporter ATP-binding protein n=1 Tax=Thermonema lapsum TaxID=28195 RepID=UPI001421069E